MTRFPQDLRLQVLRTLAPAAHLRPEGFVFFLNFESYDVIKMVNLIVMVAAQHFCPIYESVSNATLGPFATAYLAIGNNKGNVRHIYLLITYYCNSQEEYQKR